MYREREREEREREVSLRYTSPKIIVLQSFIICSSLDTPLCCLLRSRVCSLVMPHRYQSPIMLPIRRRVPQIVQLKKLQREKSIECTERERKRGEVSLRYTSPKIIILQSFIICSSHDTPLCCLLRSRVCSLVMPHRYQSPSLLQQDSYFGYHVANVLSSSLVSVYDAEEYHRLYS